MKYALSVTGMSYYSDENLMYMGIGLLFAFGIAGWFTDTLLRGTGFGMILNTLFMLGSMFAGLVIYSMFVRQIRSESPMLVILLGLGSAFFGLFLLVFLKKITLRRG